MSFKIGILGLANSGKDTFAAMLVQEINDLGAMPDLIIDRYAAPLKKLTAKIFGLTLAEVEDREIKEKPKQINRDVMIDEVFHCLERVLKFNLEEMDEASHLFFEHFQSARDISPREFQQLLGTEVVRKVKRTAWRDRLQNRPRDIVVPDVRFENELCDINILIKRFENIDRPKHESEHLAWDLQFTGRVAVLDIPLFEINNRRPISLDELRAQARATAKNIIQIRQGA